MAPLSQSELKFSGPARYRLIIKGRIAANNENLFGGFEICTLQNSKGGFQTVLEGELLDQAALAGILNTIYSLQLPLLEVLYIKPIK